MFLTFLLNHSGNHLRAAFFAPWHSSQFASSSFSSSSYSSFSSSSSTSFLGTPNYWPCNAWPCDRCCRLPCCSCHHLRCLFRRRFQRTIIQMRLNSRKKYSRPQFRFSSQDLGHLAWIWASLAEFGWMGPKGDEALRMGKGEGTARCMDVLTKGRTDSLCVLRDFVPF